jgi:putative membrane protein
MNGLIGWVAPYQFSWLAATLFPAAAVGYALGVRAVRAKGEAAGFWRPFAFFLGLALCYTVMHTKFDYYGQYLFFMHRAQHLVLHHVGAMLIALGNPLKFWGAALAPRFSTPARGLLSRADTSARIMWLLARAITIPVRVLQHPIIGSIVFVGLIYFWLTPDIHFNAMLSHNLYLLMNWSMLIDGVLFWMVIVDPRPLDTSPMPGYATRFMMIVGTTIPQILLGAYITFSKENLYNVYSVCGRAWPIAPQTDQLYGGLLTWIPPAMMELIAALIVLSLLMARDLQASLLTDANTTRESA